MRMRGFTLVELLVVLGLIMVLAAVALPGIHAYTEEAALVGAGRVFEGQFRRAYALAVSHGAQTAIVFESRAEPPTCSIYRDSNFNGVRRADIAAGIDLLVEGPVRLGPTGAGVRLAVLPGLPAIPPARGLLEGDDPIRFGNADMVSFSPLGTGSPGTLFLASRRQQVAVRVVASSARVRMLLCRGRRWSEL